MVHAGQPEATRIAVDLPQDFCGAASLGLRYPDSIQAADNGAGAVPSQTCLHSNSLPLTTYGQALREVHVGNSAADMPRCHAIYRQTMVVHGRGKVLYRSTLQRRLRTHTSLHAIAGVCLDGGSSVVTWTKVCGGAANALVPTSAVEVVNPASVDSHCAAIY